MSMEHPSLWNAVVHAIDEAMKAAPPPESTNATMRTKVYDRLLASGFLATGATQAVIETAVEKALKSWEDTRKLGYHGGPTPPFAVYSALQQANLVVAP